MNENVREGVYLNLDLQLVGDRLYGLREVFFERYFTMRKMQIITEQFTKTSLPIPFFMSKEVLNEIHFLIKAKKDKVEEILKRIEQKFLFAQLKSLLYAVGEFYRESKKYSLDKNIKKVKRIRMERLKKCKEIGLTSESEFGDIFNDNDKINTVKEIIDLLTNEFLEIVRIYIPDWNPYDEKWENVNLIDYNECPLRSKRYIHRLINLIAEEYVISRRVIIDINYRRGDHYKPAITEYRDALDHIVKSFFLPPDDAIRELNFASEHIRRAAVESVQDYVISRLEERASVLIILNSNERKKHELLKKIFDIYDEICIGRYLKGTQHWHFAIYHFYEALNKVLKLG